METGTTFERADDVARFYLLPRGGLPFNQFLVRAEATAVPHPAAPPCSRSLAERWRR
jgi:hypothetical protein